MSVAQRVPPAALLVVPRVVLLVRAPQARVLLVLVPQAPVPQALVLLARVPLLLGLLVRVRLLPEPPQLVERFSPRLQVS